MFSCFRACKPSQPTLLELARDQRLNASLRSSQSIFEDILGLLNHYKIVLAYLIKNHKHAPSSQHGDLFKTVSNYYEHRNQLLKKKKYTQKYEDKVNQLTADIGALKVKVFELILAHEIKYNALTDRNYPKIPLHVSEFGSVDMMSPEETSDDLWGIKQPPIADLNDKNDDHLNIEFAKKRMIRKMRKRLENKQDLSTIHEEESVSVNNEPQFNLTPNPFKHH